MPIPPKAVEVFYSYAHADEGLRNELEKHLKSLQRQGWITQWHDRKVLAGTEWEPTIEAHLITASVILLLISPDFMASDYCYGVEMERALERHHAGTARVIPIILRPSDWEHAPFAKLQALPTNANPVTRWRNRDEAFLDVTRGIRGVIEELQMPTTSVPPASLPLWSVPFRRNPFFTGQETILTYLHMRLTKEKAATLKQPLAISGLGGIGKTQIALEYAYRHRDEYRAVLWAKADSRESLVLDSVAIARLLQLPEQDTQDQNVTVEAVKHWLDTHDHWLLILDNADDVALISDFLSLEGKGHILLTTRAQAQGNLAQGVDIHPMEPEEATLLVLKRAKVIGPDASLADLSAADRAEARKLVQMLGGLPLALDQAAAYIEETGCGLSGYLDSYRTQRAQLLKRRGKLVTDHPEPIATTWSLSFEKVEKTDPVAANLLQFCAFLHPDAIPEELITEGASDLGPKLHALAGNLIALDEAMEVLRAYSLVHRNSEMKTLSIHRLVQAVLKDGMRKDQQRRWAERAVRIVESIFPDPQDVTTWLLCQRYLLHVQSCAELITQWHMTFPEAYILLNRAGYYLSHRAQYLEAESLYQRSLAIREQVLGPDHPDVAISLNNLATLYDEQGKYEQVESLLQRALAINEQALGLNHPEVAANLNNLAGLYMTQGRYTEAESLYQRALSINEQALEPDDPRVGIGLNNLADLYRYQGKYSEAESLYQRALAISEEALGPDHPDVAQILNNLAGLSRDQGKYTEAEPLYQRALAIREQVLGTDHPIMAQTLGGLAGLYDEQGQYIQAEPLLQRALSINEQALGPVHLNVAQILNNLAVLYTNWGKYTQAEPLYQRVLAIREQVLGLDHSDVAHALNNLAAYYLVQNKYTQAEPLLKRALAIRERVLGPDHPDVADSLNNLAQLYKAQSQFAEVASLYQRALSINERVWGPDHPSLAFSLNNLAVFYDEQGQYEQAAPLYQRALAIRERVLGPDHPNVAFSLNNLATLYHKWGKYAEAAPLYQRALAIRERVLGPDHPDVVTSLRGLAVLYDGQDQYEQAISLYQRILSILDRLLGPDHPDVVKLLNRLAQLYEAQGQYAEATSLYQRALSIIERVLGPDHPEAPMVLKNYTALLREMQRVANEEEIVGVLPPTIREAMEQGDKAAFAQAFGALSSKEQKRVADALRALQALEDDALDNPEVTDVV